MDLPDNAKVWRPPAATLAILTPGFSVTRHGNAERVSSPDELSAACLDDNILRRFVLSSPPPLLSVPDTPPAVDLEPWVRGLTVQNNLHHISLQQAAASACCTHKIKLKSPCSVKNELCLSNTSFSRLPPTDGSPKTFPEGTHSFHPHV